MTSREVWGVGVWGCGVWGWGGWGWEMDGGVVVDGVGGVSIYKCRFTSIWTLMLNITWSRDRLLFSIGTPYLGRRSLYWDGAQVSWEVGHLHHLRPWRQFALYSMSFCSIGDDHVIETLAVFAYPLECFCHEPFILNNGLNLLPCPPNLNVNVVFKKGILSRNGPF